MGNNNETKTQTSHFFNLVSAFLAFFLWGGWAYYINCEFGIKVGIVSGITQGIASFSITLFMIRAVTKIFYWLFKTRLQVVLPAVITVSFTGSCLALIHYIVGTPNIIYTIAPALSVAFSFCLFTTYKLKKAKNP